MKNILDTNEFHTNQIIRRNKKYKVCVYIYIYIYSYLINYEDFNNLNGNGNMAGTGIIAGICTSPYPMAELGDDQGSHGSPIFFLNFFIYIYIYF